MQLGPAALSCSPTLHEGRAKFAERQGGRQRLAEKDGGRGSAGRVPNLQVCVCHDDTPSLFEPENSHLPSVVRSRHVGEMGDALSWKPSIMERCSHKSQTAAGT